MDEPFTNLDVAGRDLVIAVVTEHLEQGGVCVMASHQAVEVAAETKRLQL